MVLTLLVTVGTTKFENLIKAIDTEEFYELLIQLNFTHVIIQKGSGEYIPTKFKEYKLTVQIETLLPNFQEVIKRSDYIISHGGAGNILECLKFKKKIFVVVNDQLMDNHQVELAESLAVDGYIYYIKQTNKIVEELRKHLGKNTTQLKEYPEFNLETIPNVIYEMLDI